MGKVDIKSLFYSLQSQMITKLSTNRQHISHPGIKGDSSELNWVEWLKTYLPKRYCVDKALIIDCEGNTSDQIDVVIYDQQYSPFVFNQDNAFYIPAESIYAIFEVKQEINKEYVEYAGEKTKSVRSLIRTSAIIPHAGGFYEPKQHKGILSGLLTLSSSWSPPLGDSFEKAIYNLDAESRLDMGCVLEEGAFLVDYEKTRVQKSTKEESLIFFFLKLLIELQKLGTVPAIDIDCYGSSLDSI
ncbi:hypothetical protein DP73_17655 [Desulfosporosinus sp. HMP52]|uniref:DUF6602 domain-containing protein n=1 Tax=Desulfosporosinus sp. HMP52 TaxID=1487923 RepID=UPI00051FE773|nr:DUF6602 domain-containing protein [Desulfosporosinus sp. HMP52]KGK85860.1 hypothetical protein DP73_17655 [Desulfosporosinus sp. HMP52]